MALIQCPECGKEISDKAESCPSCGCPVNPASQNVESPSTSVKPVKKPSKKAMITTGAAVLVIVLVVFAVNMSNKASARKNYIEALTDARMTMLLGAADAEGLCNLARSVWNNTIFEERDSKTDKYTMYDRNHFNSDFNTSLHVLYLDTETQSTISSIKENQGKVAELMKSLQNPSDEFATCYDTVNSMYEAYQELTGLAISPAGNLSAYSGNISTSDSEFMKNYNKLESQIPSE